MRAPAISAASPRRRRAIAASVLLATGAGLWVWMQADSAATYSTPIGVTAAVPLQDGSKITLNTASEIHVAMTETERRVELAQGEAFFDVVHDPARPFTVDAGGKRIVVLGTRFSVRRDRDEVRVVVTEGKVRVDDMQLTAGVVADSKGAGVEVEDRGVDRAEELLSWRQGYLVFHETSLAQAVAEFNRYNTRRFVIEDPEVAAISVSGNFRSTNVDSFVRLLEDGFPVSVDRQDGRIVLRQRR